MEDILLHMCCGPCALFPIQKLRDSGFEPHGYFYNINIHPYKEFKRRLETAQQVAEHFKMDFIVDPSYELEKFLRLALNAEGDRCEVCYHTRLYQAAAYAAEHGYKKFTSSLLVSPYQKHELIRQVGEAAAAASGVEFVYYDFREGWHDGVQLSRELELYRQPYCGCIFSEKERYYKPKKA